MSLRVTFPSQLRPRWSINMIKVLVLRFNLCFGLFTMSRVEGPLKPELLDIYPTTSFDVSNFSNTEAMRVIFFCKCSKLNADMKNAEKDCEKIFCFRVKWIWIVCIELPLLITEYFSSAVNVLTKSLKTFHATKSYFSDSITFRVINQYGKGAGVKNKSVFWPVYHVSSRGVLSNGSF